MKHLSKFPVILLFSILVLVSKNTIAQNYEAIKTDAEYFFLDSISRDIIAIRIDSAKVTGNDIIYYNYKQMRPSDNICFSPGASWLGEILEKPDCMFIFSGYTFSPANSIDTFRIQTKAGINQPWHFYNYTASSDYIEANIPEINLMAFLNLTDSVKVITLTRKNLSGQIVSDPVNSQKILLSKNFGLIRLPKFEDLTYFNNFYDLVGKTNPETGITNLKTMQIYDFQPGDEFHTVYYNRYFSIPYPETTISTIMKVLSKTVSISGDSVNYEFEQCQSNCYKLSDTSITITYRIDTISEFYSTQSSPEFESEPLEPVSAMQNDWVISTFMGLSADPLFPFTDLPYKAIQSLEAYSYSSQNCYTPVMIDGCLSSVYYFKGLGGPYYNCSEISWGPSYNLLKYYKKGSETWGMPLSCDSLRQVGLPEYAIIGKINIYPNPATDNITISIPAGLSLPGRFYLFDISGRLVKELTINQPSQSFDISELPSGLYTYNLTTTKGEVFHGKIIRQ